MNWTIYKETVLKICRHKFIMAFMIMIAISGPALSNANHLSVVLPPVNAVDPFTVSVLLGFLIVTITSCIGSSISMGGRSDYMPLIVTRPVPRFHYVISKWLALATIMASVTLCQNLIITLSLTTGSWGLTPEMIACSYLDRIVAALTISSIFTFLYLLPNQTCILVGIVAFELAIGIKMMPMTMVFPQSASNTDIAYMQLQILGTMDWLSNTVLPTLIGGSAVESFQSYMTLLYQSANFLAPKVDTYDLVTARPFFFSPVLEVISNTLIALTCATLIVNSREYHYDAD